MLIRYRRTEDGHVIAKAIVYTQQEHHIEKGRLDPDALRIVERLRENGHEAYIVGGAVRDLLVGRRPKDFDIVTDAQPPRIKRVFRNSRVIGRRFRLVHVYAGPKIFEVSTFRSIANGTVGNEFGTMDEDALRRDFTLNALYYDPIEDVLVDYVGGLKDIEAKRIKPVIPLKAIFKEDPVRMIRCIKYSRMIDFKIPLTTRMALRRDSALLAKASPSRLTEEFVKILGSGFSSRILFSLAEYDLLKALLPEAARLLERDQAYRAALLAELAELDEFAASPAKEKRLAAYLGFFLKPYLVAREGLIVDTPEAYQEALREARLFLCPLNLPRVELEAAVLFVFKKLGISPSQKPRRQGAEGEGEGPHRPRRRRRKPASNEALPEGAPRETPPGQGGSLAPKSPRTNPPQSRAGAEKKDPRPPIAKTTKEGGNPSLEGSSEGSSAKRRRRRKRKPNSEGGSPDIQA